MTVIIISMYINFMQSNGNNGLLGTGLITLTSLSQK